MAASPVSIPSASPPSHSISLKRRPLALTQRRLEANRRNAARSTGPRTSEGKARVGRNAIKHGFFAARERWSPHQQRDFEDLLFGLRDDLKPQGATEESHVTTIAESYVRMAALLRYENIAAFEYHQRQDRELSERIAAASPAEATRLEATREELRRAGLWRPTLPGPREAAVIIRYQGSLDRTIHRTLAELTELKRMRGGQTKTQKQTHFAASPGSDREAVGGAPVAISQREESQKQTHFEESVPSRGVDPNNGKTNPLNPMFMGNRHERRRAKALAKRRR